jgi:putative ABC transport system ATP-binding protein
VQVHGVTKHFGSGERRIMALRGVDLDAYPNQMTLLVGPSGCGKTTLLSVIAGILDCDEGSVVVFGDDVTRMSDVRKTRFRARSIGFVFQQYNLLPALTAVENVAVPLIIAGVRRREAIQRAAAVLESLEMGNRMHNLPTQLSGGQQQRVAIGRSLVHEPKLLVCDEPTAALDHETGQHVMELLVSSAVRPDRAVIVVTHDNRVFHLGDRIAHMDDGKITEIEEPAGRAGHGPLRDANENAHQVGRGDSAGKGGA